MFEAGGYLDDIRETIEEFQREFNIKRLDRDLMENCLPKLDGLYEGWDGDVMEVVDTIIDKENEDGYADDEEEVDDDDEPKMIMDENYELHQKQRELDIKQKEIQDQQKLLQEREALLLEQNKLLQQKENVFSEKEKVLQGKYEILLEKERLFDKKQNECADSEDCEQDDDECKEEKKEKPKSEYPKANQCKAITKEGNQCKNTKHSEWGDYCWAHRKCSKNFDQSQEYERDYYEEQHYNYKQQEEKKKNSNSKENDDKSKLQKALAMFGFKNGEFNEEMLKTTYHKLSKIYHPDKGGSVEKMQELNQYKEILENELKKYY